MSGAFAEKNFRPARRKNGKRRDRSWNSGKKAYTPVSYTHLGDTEASRGQPGGWAAVSGGHGPVSGRSFSGDPSGFPDPGTEAEPAPGFPDPVSFLGRERVFLFFAAPEGAVSVSYTHLGLPSGS